MTASALPPLSPIERPRCPKCAARMMLARISPGPAEGCECRTFECPKCDHMLTVTVAVDPMQSDDAVGWVAGELKPPD
jgi:hypothetical protein